MIQVQHLSKLYDDFLAVDNVDFELQAGQICGLVGPKRRRQNNDTPLPGGG